MKLPGMLTAAELIAQLQQLPPETNCYIRGSEGLEVFWVNHVSTESDMVHGVVAIIEHAPIIENS